MASGTRTDPVSVVMVTGQNGPLFHHVNDYLNSKTDHFCAFNVFFWTCLYIQSATGGEEIPYISGARVHVHKHSADSCARAWRHTDSCAPCGSRPISAARWARAPDSWPRTSRPVFQGGSADVRVPAKSFVWWRKGSANTLTMADEKPKVSVY